MMKLGKFIVIEGIDGSGKATQVELLSKWLSKEGRRVAFTDFPQYGQPSAHFVERYLRGEYGSAKEVGPYRASLFYALDRYEKSPDIKRWLAEGRVVISNRYVSANMGHQGGKLAGVARDEFLAWLSNLEYDILGVPKPDVTIMLYVDPRVAQTFVDLKGKRNYTHGKKRDLHEADITHLRKAAAAYRAIAKKYGWVTINCVKGGKVLPINEVHQRVVAAVKKFL